MIIKTKGGVQGSDYSRQINLRQPLNEQVVEISVMQIKRGRV